jgi:hypothetical protein
MVRPLRLRCSFCYRDEATVTKLVAGPRMLFIGPRVHICDACVAMSSRIMDESDGENPTRGPADHRHICSGTA